MSTQKKTNTKTEMIGDKKVTFRKWKGKDKKEFIKCLKNPEMEFNDVIQSLVYSCIEDDKVVFGVEELKYLLSRIRAFSLGEYINIELLCTSCMELHKQDFKLSDIIRQKWKPLEQIEVGETTIKFGPIRNREKYIDMMEIDDSYDFIMRIEQFNDLDIFTVQELEDMIDDLDVEDLTLIMAEFMECQFKVDDINSVTCPHCKEITEYEFDEIPGFLPNDWAE